MWTTFFSPSYDTQIIACFALFRDLNDLFDVNVNHYTFIMNTLSPTQRVNKLWPNSRHESSMWWILWILNVIQILYSFEIQYFILKVKLDCNWLTFFWVEFIELNELMKSHPLVSEWGLEWGLHFKLFLLELSSLKFDASEEWHWEVEMARFELN